MYRQILWTITFVCSAMVLCLGQNRAIDGTLNNLSNPELGATGAEIRRITTVDYEDGYASPGGADRPNPRIISNELFAQDSLLNDPLNLSDYTWVFGQFIDHDITSISNDPTEPANILVDFHDPWFNPGGAVPNTNIFMFRNQAMPGTGTDINNPRVYSNNITSWLDGSGIYGSDIDRVNYLRSFVDGKMRTSSGNLLPYNTVTGEESDPVDSAAPHMDNENPFTEKLFVAGDVRANENLQLAAFHTLFVREHNRLCDVLKAENPTWADEELYQRARKLNGAYLASIVFNEWLPAMGIELPAYTGYDESVNPNITNVFSAAAFRMGHTLLNSTTMRLDNDGEVIPEGHIGLKDAFFNPSEIPNAGGIDPLFKGMAAQTQQNMDCKVINDVRNFLFGPPVSGLGGLDLASININRGRERGLPDFNTIRQDLGLSPYNSFYEINSDSAAMAIMENLYGDVNDIDPWVGMLAEEHMDGALIGETVMEIMKLQFSALRDGDRFYYENDPEFTAEEIEEINNTTLRDIIMRNTGVSVMQMNVFEAMPHDSICPAEAPFVDVSGAILTELGEEIQDVDVEITNLESNLVAGTGSTQNGEYLIEDLATCQQYRVTPSKNINHGNGLSTFDLVMITRHILAVQTLDSPYKMLAADVNNSGSISATDLIDMRKVILMLQDTFTNSPSWRFVANDFTFPDVNDPWSVPFPEYTDVAYLSEDLLKDFTGIKIGDVNDSADPANFITGEDRNDYSGTMILELDNPDLKAGETYSVQFKARDLARIAGFQFSLQYDDRLENVRLMPNEETGFSGTHYHHIENQQTINISWNSETSVSAEETVFTLIFTAAAEGKLNEALNLNPNLISAEAYSTDLDIMEVLLVFNDSQESLSADFILYQNQPNPFAEQTQIGFYLPGNSKVSLRIFDMAGKTIKLIQNNFSKGYHSIDLDRSELITSGVLFYQLTTDFGQETRKMILLDQDN